ncbi:MAG: prolipoprotein diacylglyceryl transferase [Sporomusaceae bacterium]|nr:prolipoprotein diacylglyceryl transferase [Sporomusaceae bacterium]
MINSAVLSLGAIGIQPYGSVVVLAIIASALFALWQGKRQKLPLGPIAELFIFSLPCGILGGRAYYVLINWPYYSNHLQEIFLLNRGGFAAHGALMAVFCFGLIYIRSKKLAFGQFADFFAMVMALGEAIGQWANIMNQEAIGYPTQLSWGIYVDYAMRPVGYEDFDFFHPIFAYQSLLSFVLLFVLLLIQTLDRQQKLWGTGRLFCFYLFSESAGRFVMEGMRLDSEVLYGYNIAQVGSVCFMVLALLLFTATFLKRSNLAARIGKNAGQNTTKTTIKVE